MNRSRFVIWNSQAGAADRHRGLKDRLARRSNTMLVETTNSEEARHEAEAAAVRCETIVAAGGDGTVNAVVNGMAAAHGKARLAILPLGAGNDLCRTLDIPLDPVEAAEVLDRGRTTRIDMVEARAPGIRMWCVNGATGGNANRIDEGLSDELKRRWGPLCYFRGALSAPTDIIEYDMTVRLDALPPERFHAANLILGNCRTAAGGLGVAPRANPADGRLDVVVISSRSRFDVVALAARLLSGDYLDSEQVAYRQAGRVEIESTPAFAFSVDGEPLEGQPTVFEVLPRALRVVVGPGYSPRPCAPGAMG